MAGSVAKRITGHRIGTDANKDIAQYRYDPGNDRTRGRGPGAHYVIPDIWGGGLNDATPIAEGAGSNGLRRGTGVTVATGKFLRSAPLDLSGWPRFSVLLSFGAAILAGSSVGYDLYADPAFNNFIGQPGGLAIAAASTFAVVDTGSSAWSTITPWTPYIKFVFFNGTGIDVTVNGSMVLYDYLVR